MHGLFISSNELYSLQCFLATYSGMSRRDPLWSLFTAACHLSRVFHRSSRKVVVAWCWRSDINDSERATRLARSSAYLWRGDAFVVEFSIVWEFHRNNRETRSQVLLAILHPQSHFQVCTAVIDTASFLHLPRAHQVCYRTPER